MHSEPSNWRPLMSYTCTPCSSLIAHHVHTRHSNGASRRWRPRPTPGQASLWAVSAPLTRPQAPDIAECTIWCGRAERKRKNHCEWREWHRDTSFLDHSHPIRMPLSERETLCDSGPQLDITTGQQKPLRGWPRSYLCRPISSHQPSVSAEHLERG